MRSGREGSVVLFGGGLEPEVAIGTGLITEVFGFASGVTSYVRQRLIDYELARSLVLVTLPSAVLGSWITGLVRADLLEAILGTGLIALALSFLKAPDADERERLDAGIESEYGGEAAQTSITTARGEEIRYTVCNRFEGRSVAAVGALFMGMISTGLGELNGYFLLRRCRVPRRVAVATGVLVVAVSALAAATTHLWRFVSTGGDSISARW